MKKPHLLQYLKWMGCLCLVYLSRKIQKSKKQQRILNSGKERKHAILYTTTCTVLS